MLDRGPVLHVLQPAVGGVPEHVLMLVRGLSARGWSVEVATTQESVLGPALRELGIPLHVLPLVRAPRPSDVAAARALRRLDRRRGYRIVHAHSSKAGALVRATLPGLRRFVYTPHCFAFAAGFGPMRRLAYQAVEQALVPRSAAIVAVCEWERSLGARRLRGSARRLRVVRNGVAPCAQARPDPELADFKRDLPLAGMVSRLDAQKDPLALVRAAAILSERSGPPGRFAIVGNGPLGGAVRSEIARLGLAPHVRWFPFKRSVAPYLQALDVFVLPSLWEALPLAVLEAMSCRLPVLATRVGGVPEMVEEGTTGLLAPPGSPWSLAEGLEALLSDPERRRRMGAAGRAAVHERFSVERMVAATVEVYEALGT